jgi:hypothetical protein
MIYVVRDTQQCAYENTFDVAYENTFYAATCPVCIYVNTGV